MQAAMAAMAWSMTEHDKWYNTPYSQQLALAQQQQATLRAL